MKQFEPTTGTATFDSLNSRGLIDKNRDPSTRHGRDKDKEGAVGVSSMEKRFAYSLLEKLLEYVDKAAYNMKQTKPASKFSRRHSYSTATEDVKFFGKVIYFFENIPNNQLN